jgi:hypothetical protein
MDVMDVMDVYAYVFVCLFVCWGFRVSRDCWYARIPTYGARVEGACCGLLLVAVDCSSILFILFICIVELFCLHGVY